MGDIIRGAHAYTYVLSGQYQVGVDINAITDDILAGNGMRLIVGMSIVDNNDNVVTWIVPRHCISDTRLT